MYVADTESADRLLFQCSTSSLVSRKIIPMLAKNSKLIVIILKNIIIITINV